MKMNKVKAFLGYMIAALMVPLVIVGLMSYPMIGEGLVNGLELEISPWFTGGAVVRTVSHAGYETRIHRPVFDALIGKRQEGFVQVVWAKTETLPVTLSEEIDYDGDGKVDFAVTLDPRTKTATWQPYSSQALELLGLYEIGDGIGVRIKLMRE
jgi:hypothetical protein